MILVLIILGVGKLFFQLKKSNYKEELIIEREDEKLESRRKMYEDRLEGVNEFEGEDEVMIVL